VPTPPNSHGSSFFSQSVVYQMALRNSRGRFAKKSSGTRKRNSRGRFLRKETRKANRKANRKENRKETRKANRKD